MPLEQSKCHSKFIPKPRLYRIIGCMTTLGIFAVIGWVTGRTICPKFIPNYPLSFLSRRIIGRICPIVTLGIIAVIGCIWRRTIWPCLFLVIGWLWRRPIGSWLFAIIGWLCRRPIFAVIGWISRRTIWLWFMNSDEICSECGQYCGSTGCSDVGKIASLTIQEEENVKREISHLTRFDKIQRAA